MLYGSKLYFAMQGFTFRFINYLEFLLVRLVVMGGSTTAEKEMTRRYGYTADGSWTAKSTAAAYIIVGDWALEHPFPLPPKAHVSPWIHAFGHELHASCMFFFARRQDASDECLPQPKQGSFGREAAA